MKANPGGLLTVDQVIGRNQLIESLWEILENQSVIMTAERRIGKTSVIRKMQSQPPAGWVPVLQDLEQYHSADEFAAAVYDSVKDFLASGHQTMQVLRTLWESLGGTEIGGVLTLPPSQSQGWKTLLTATIEHLVDHQADRRLVFFWDEMPYMLESISKRQGENVAIELLDVLRSLRQKHAGFRIVITGSIGLHHVLTALKGTDYKNEPLNDMYPFEITPLALEDAIFLAETLIRGEQLDAPAITESAATIAKEGDCFPFYIHHIVKHLKITRRPVNPDTIRESVSEQLIDPNDPWELAHFRDRIPQYYPEDADLAFTILDCLTTRSEPAPVNDMLAEIKSQLAFDDRNHLLEVLRLMERDHYLRRDTEGRYCFRFPLIQRWWRLDRGLEDG